MQLQQKLMEKDKITPKPSSEYFIDRYNNVIHTYNKSVESSCQLSRPQSQQHEQSQTEIQNSMRLEYLDTTQLFKKLNKILSNNCVKVVLVLLLAFLPFANLVIYGAFWFYFLFLKRQGKKHSSNLKKTGNPLESYYFLPEMCEQLSKHCTTIQISPKELQGFTFNDSLHWSIKQRQKQCSNVVSSQVGVGKGGQKEQKNSTGESNSDVITVTIYDQYFYDSFHLFKKQQYKVGAWILLATFLIAADVVFYGALFDLL